MKVGSVICRLKSGTSRFAVGHMTPGVGYYTRFDTCIKSLCRNATHHLSVQTAVTRTRLARRSLARLLQLSRKTMQADVCSHCLVRIHLLSGLALSYENCIFKVLPDCCDDSSGRIILPLSITVFFRNPW